MIPQNYRSKRLNLEILIRWLNNINLYFHLNILCGYRVTSTKKQTLRIFGDRLPLFLGVVCQQAKSTSEAGNFHHINNGFI